MIKSWADFSLICSLDLLVNRLIVFVGHDDGNGWNLKVYTHTYTPHTHPHPPHTAPFCLHSWYLFLRWIVSEAQHLHGDGSPQIRMRKRERRRRLRTKAMLPAYLPLLYTCWHTYCISWYGFTRQLIYSLSPSLSAFQCFKLSGLVACRSAFTPTCTPSPPPPP